MALQKDYDSVMARSNDIQKEALGLDYAEFERSPIAFDYEKLMESTGYTLEKINEIQSQYGVGNTPLREILGNEGSKEELKQMLQAMLAELENN